MRHGRGADLSLDDSLSEVAQAHILPHIATEVHEDHVDAAQAVAVSRNVVVVGDLRCESLALEPQAATKLCEGQFPVDLGRWKHVLWLAPHVPAKHEE